jgi:putative tricarboxylic transport membrane protein
MRQFLNRDTVTAAGLLLFAGAAWLQTTSLPAGAALFPQLSLLLLALCSLAYVLRSVVKGIPKRQYEPLFHHPARFAIAFAAIAFYALVFPRIGYFTATLVFIPALVAALGMRRYRLTLISTAIFTVLVYLLFVVLLGRYLPKEVLLGAFS